MVVDVCVIGAGAAGLTLAQALASSGCSVDLLEGGSKIPRSDLEDTFRAEVVGMPHRGVHEGRFRAYGGTTTRWAGQLLPWEAHEFEPRDWIPGSGWPISFEEVAAHYPEASALLNVPYERFDDTVLPPPGIDLPELDPALFAYRFPKTARRKYRNMGRTIGHRLLRKPNVAVYLGTTAVELITDPTGLHVEELRCQTANGAEDRFRARYYVLSAGAIENARLLLASRRFVPEGIGNGTDQVGRCFQDHLYARVAEVKPVELAVFSRFFAPFFIDGVMHSPRMVLSTRVQSEERLLGCYGHWEANLPEDSGIPILREKLLDIQAGAGLKITLHETRKIAESGLDVLRLASGMFLEKRRHFPRKAKIYLDIETEQLPNPESRITLSDERDEYGLPRTVVDWKVTDLERRTMRRCAELLAAELGRLNLCDVILKDGAFDGCLSWSAQVTDYFHMMGGTRMSETPEDGVVNTDCRVHETDNLFVAGASIFPTFGKAHPTLTLMALSLRLADHLRQLLRQS